MLTPMPAVATTERPAMPERSVATQVNGDTSSVGGHRRTAAGAVSSPPAPVRTPTVAALMHVGTRLSETLQRPEPALAR
jgi:hypothetical protein